MSLKLAAVGVISNCNVLKTSPIGAGKTMLNGLHPIVEFLVHPLGYNEFSYKNWDIYKMFSKVERCSKLPSFTCVLILQHVKVFRIYKV